MMSKFKCKINFAHEGVVVLNETLMYFVPCTVNSRSLLSIIYHWLTAISQNVVQPKVDVQTCTCRWILLRTSNFTTISLMVLLSQYAPITKISLQNLVSYDEKGVANCNLKIQRTHTLNMHFQNTALQLLSFCTHSMGFLAQVVLRRLSLKCCCIHVQMSLHKNQNTR